MIDFKKYDADNPQIWDKFEELTFRAIRKGFKHYSTSGIFELIRWYTGTSSDYADGYKISNNYKPDYGRKFMKKYPEHKGFFRTKSIKVPRT